MDSTGASDDVERLPRPSGAQWGRRLLVAGVVGVLGYLLISVLGDISWTDVGDALARLTVWQLVVLLAVVLVRQCVSAVPLRLLVPELGLRRALVNDLSANLVATVSPAPSDLVLRIAMFRSWDVDASRGVTGLVLQSLLFYVARLLAPVLGFVLLAVALEETDPVHSAAALTSGLLAVGLAVVLWLAGRSRGSARRLGEWGDRLAGRIRPSWAAPRAWPDRVEQAHGEVSDMVRRRAWVVEVVYLVFLLVEALLLLLGMRFVGVPAADASAMLIVGALLVVYPLTGLPLMGLGALDAALVALIASAGPADPDALVAGVIVWRVAIQLVPLALGAVTLVVWRRGHPVAAPGQA